MLRSGRLLRRYTALLGVSKVKVRESTRLLRKASPPASSRPRLLSERSETMGATYMGAGEQTGSLPIRRISTRYETKRVFLNNMRKGFVCPWVFLGFRPGFPRNERQSTRSLICVVGINRYAVPIGVLYAKKVMSKNSFIRDLSCRDSPTD
jgi:hypothetical protein